MSLLLARLQSGAVISASASESIAASDALEVTSSMPVVSSEVAAGSDTNAVVAQFNPTLTETTSGSDTTNRFFTVPLTSTEATTGSDSSSTLASLTAAASETTSGADSSDRTYSVQRSLTDGTTGSDTTTTLAVFNPTITDSTTSSDAQDRYITVGRSIAETTSALESQDRSNQTSSAATETVAATETQSQTIGSTTHNVDGTEATSGSNSESATVQFGVSRIEPTTGVDTISVAALFKPNVSDAAVGSDVGSVRAAFVPSSGSEAVRQIIELTVEDIGVTTFYPSTTVNSYGFTYHPAANISVDGLVLYGMIENVESQNNIAYAGRYTSGKSSDFFYSATVYYKKAATRQVSFEFNHYTQYVDILTDNTVETNTTGGTVEHVHVGGGVYKLTVTWVAPRNQVVSVTPTLYGAGWSMLSGQPEVFCISPTIINDSYREISASQSSLSTLQGATTDSANAVATENRTFTATVVTTETTTGSDTPSNTVQFGVSDSEAANAAHTNTAGMRFNPTRTDSAAATDSESATSALSRHAYTANSKRWTTATEDSAIGMTISAFQEGADNVIRFYETADTGSHFAYPVSGGYESVYHVTGLVRGTGRYSVCADFYNQGTGSYAGYVYLYLNGYTISAVDVYDAATTSYTHGPGSFSFVDNLDGTASFAFWSDKSRNVELWIDLRRPGNEPFGVYNFTGNTSNYIDLVNLTTNSVNPAGLMAQDSAQGLATLGVINTETTTGSDTQANTVQFGVVASEAAQRTNFVRNSMMTGAAVGVLPTTWANGQGGGISVSVVATGVEDNLPYVDIRWSGTAAAQTYPGVYIITSNDSIPATQGTKFVEAIDHKLVSGSTGEASPYLSFREWDVNTITSASDFGGFTPTLTYSRFIKSVTVNSVNTVKVGLYLLASVPAGTYDFTIRVRAVQLEYGLLATPFIPTTNAAVTVNASDYNGSVAQFNTALTEVAQRTNLIPNSMMVGAGVGVLPSVSWSRARYSAEGMDVQVVGTGVEDSRTYIDVRFFGTNTSAGIAYPSVFPSDPSFVNTPAQRGEAITVAVDIKVVSGSAGNIGLSIRENTSAGAYIANGTTYFAVTENWSRYSATRVLVNASVGRTGFGILRNVAVAETIDFTLRIAAPQLERLNVATPFIPTYGTVVTVNASDYDSSAAQYGRSATEATTSSDSLNGLSTLQGATTDSTNGLDNVSSLSTLQGSASDAATGSDSSTNTTQFGVSRTEPTTGTDATSTTAQYKPSVSDSTTSLDSNSSTASFFASGTEATSAVDMGSTGGSLAVLAQETTNSTEQQNRTASFGVSLADGTTASDTATALLQLLAQNSESVTPVDYVSASALLYATEVASTISSESVFGVTTLQTILSDATSASSTTSSRLDMSAFVSDAVVATSSVDVLTSLIAYAYDYTTAESDEETLLILVGETVEQTLAVSVSDSLVQKLIDENNLINVFKVQGEGRGYVILADNREVAIPGEVRSFGVESDQRVLSVGDEGRLFMVQKL